MLNIKGPGIHIDNDSYEMLPVFSRLAMINHSLSAITLIALNGKSRK